MLRFLSVPRLRLPTVKGAEAAASQDSPAQTDRPHRSEKESHVDKKAKTARDRDHHMAGAATTRIAPRERGASRP
eukprot:2516437-Rhodomonas_salina.1